MSALLSTPDESISRPSLVRGLVQAAVLTAIMFGSLGLYLIVLKWRGPAARLNTWTPWDEIIPFRPEWVWPYLLPYALAPVFFFLLTPRSFQWFLRHGLVIVAVSLPVFIVLPTQTAPRPAGPSPGDALTALLYDNMIAIDEPPANAAPSLHVSLTCLLALALARDFPRWRAVAFGGAALVWLATLGSRQHHLIDVGTGVFLTFLVVAGSALFSRGREGPLPRDLE
jgi:hypothetical protein